MRVLIVAPLDGATHAWIRRGFGQSGHEVQEFDYRQVAAKVGVPGMNAELVRLVAARRQPGKAPIDLVLVLKGELVSPATLRESRRHAKVALWHFDPRDGRDGWLVERAAAVDEFFTIARGLGSFYEGKGVRWHWLLEGADEVVHSPPPKPVEPKYPVSFVGTVKDVQGREAWLQGVARRHGAGFHVWGSFCPESLHPFYHGRAEGDVALRAVIHESAVNLGRDRNPEIERSYGARLFRTLACGGALLTNDTIGLREDFGDAVAIYEKDGDCSEAAAELAVDAARRARMGAKGRALVLERHTFRHRTDEIVKVMGL